MTIDLTGGMEASSDHFFAECPADRRFRERASTWHGEETYGMMERSIPADQLER